MKKSVFNGAGIKRRSFLKTFGISSVGMGLGFPFFARRGRASQQTAGSPVAVWKTDADGNRYFVPQNLWTDEVNDKNQLTARVDGWPRTYTLREFSDEFHDWWIEEKMWYYDELIAFVEGESESFHIPNGGHHHPMLSTYGRIFGKRGDSDFHLNTAVKGFTIIPKQSNIDYINTEVAKVYETGSIPGDLFNLRKQLYQDKSLWDKTRFATLELYSGRPINIADPEGPFGFTETHTFQNVYVNPMATLSYMSLYNTEGGQSYLGGAADLTPHFEFRGFCWLVSYYNPANTGYEKAIADYINGAHCGWHGGACDVTTNIFLIAEQFNNTPDYDAGRGKRVVPPESYGQAGMRVVKPHGKKMLSKRERIELIKKLRLPV